MHHHSSLLTPKPVERELELSMTHQALHEQQEPTTCSSCFAKKPTLAELPVGCAHEWDHKECPASREMTLQSQHPPCPCHLWICLSSSLGPCWRAWGDMERAFAPTVQRCQRNQTKCKRSANTMQQLAQAVGRRERDNTIYGAREREFSMGTDHAL